MSYVLGNTERIKKYGGVIYYVATDGSDANPGTDPILPLLTIGAAITACSAGDAISIKSGTYTETGLDVDEDAIEVWCEIGTVIDPASGVALTVSGAYCKIDGNVLITPAAAVGLLVSGTGFVGSGISIVGGTDCFSMTGSGYYLENCSAATPSAGNAGFALSASNGVLRLCNTVGNTTTTGFEVNNSADSGILDRCTSVAHATAGYSFATGSSAWTVKDCSSGKGDGRWVDIDEAQVFSNFTFDNLQESEIDIAQGGAGTYTYNVFKVTGVVQITSINGVVETTLTGSNLAVYLDVYSVNGSDSLSKTSTLTIGAALEGALIAKLDLADKILSFHDADAPFLVEGIDAAAQSFKLGQDRTGGASVDTYVRFVHTTAGAKSGEIHWYAQWTPISEDGFLEPA